MTNKRDKQFFFETQLVWKMDNEGVVSNAHTPHLIAVDTPVEFGGAGKEWSPEHLFLSAVSSCFLSTFLLFAKKFRVEFTQITCNCIGQVEIVEGKYKFTHINLYPKITVVKEDFKEKAGLALEKTHQHCLVGNSVNASIIYHSEVIIVP